jgi:hypothetical protein
MSSKRSPIPEGHFTISRAIRTEDCDHGPCTGYYVEELGVWFFTYDRDATRVSFSADKGYAE